MKRDKRINEALGGSLTDVLASGTDASLATPDTGTPMVSRSPSFRIAFSVSSLLTRMVRTASSR